MRQLHGQMDGDMEEGCSARDELTLADKWEGARARRDGALAKLDRLAMMGSELNLDADRTAAVKDLVEALTALETQHTEMRNVKNEMAGSTANGQDTMLVERLERQRNQRVRRPRNVCQHSVSNCTGQGLEDLWCVFKALTEDKRLFPHVGMQVPLNYSMLERLAQEGRLQSRDNEEDDIYFWSESSR
jgi:hypothetical protein